MNNTTFTCYGCAKTNILRDQLRYECMCMERKGVCRDCEKKPIGKWQLPFPAEHRLQKIHDLTNETKAYWDEVEQKIPNWGSWVTSVDGKKIIFSRYDDPFDPTTKRTVEMSTFPKSYCTCCTKKEK